MTKPTKPPKPFNRRSSTKYPALDPELNLKTRFELIDYDYLDRLSEEEKEWLNNFTEEYTNANLDHKGEILNKGKRRKKDCYDRNNARNRCILTRAKASGMDTSLEEVKDFKGSIPNPEDTLIFEMDKSNTAKNVTAKKKKK